MKTFRILSALLLIASVLLIPVSAAVEFVPSIAEKRLDLVDHEVGEDGYSVVCYVEAANGAIIAKLTRKTTDLINYSELDKAPEKIQDALKTAAEQLKNNSLEDLVPGFAEAWAELTDGGPVSNAVVAHLFDISTTYKIPEGVKLHFDLEGHDVHPDTHVMLLHLVDGKWEIVEADHNADEHVEFWVDGLSPFALIIDSENAPAVDANAPKSPSTYETVLRSAPIAAAVVLFGLGCVCLAVSKRTAK